MADAGTALMGVGYGTGEERAVAAAKAAINSPLLDVSIDGARGVLFNVSGGADMTMWEINEAARIITNSIDSTAKVIFGAVHDDRLKKGEIKITVIATGFTEARASKTVPTDDVTQAVKRFAPQEARAPQEVPPVEAESEWDAVPAFLRRKLK
jgi:cell division protein FtsZ